MELGVIQPCGPRGDNARGTQRFQSAGYDQHSVLHFVCGLAVQRTLAGVEANPENSRPNPSAGTYGGGTDFAHVLELLHRAGSGEEFTASELEAVTRTAIRLVRNLDAQDSQRLIEAFSRLAANGSPVLE